MLTVKRTEQKIVNGWNENECLVSIICNTFNHERYIEKAIDGFLKQHTVFPFEILINDDASTDGTAEIIKEYELNFPEIIKPIYQIENQYSKGVRITNEIQIPRSSGKYLAMCEGDDYWTDPHKLAKQVKFLEQNPNYVGCFTNFMTVNKNGRVISNEGFKNMKSEYSHLDVLSIQTPKTLTVVYRKEYAPKNIPENLRKCLNGDLINASLVSINGPYKFMDFISGAYRVHTGGIWSTIGKEKSCKAQIDTCNQLLKYFKKKRQRKAIRVRLNNFTKMLLKLQLQKMQVRSLLTFIYYINNLIRLKLPSLS